MHRLCLISLLAAGPWACDDAADPAPEAAATLAVKADIDDQLAALHAAAVALQAAAPAPDDDGWNATDDAAAVAAMRAEWRKARVAYERIEGAIAVLFPELDAATDERYDGFIEGGADDDLFDADGVTGVHAVERILWADAHPAHVVAFEAGLPAYAPAAFPANRAEAEAFKSALAQRLVDDTAAMRDDFAPLALDAAAAFRGVIGSLAEQAEKIGLASTGEDESRYAQHTLADMRANLAGSEATYAHFRGWIRAEGGDDLDADIIARLAALRAALDALPGDALPPVPAGFDADAPSAEHLATPYGQLFALVAAEADPDRPGSLVAQMSAAADLIGIPQIPE
ncbi:MAG: EfeM/EfeO family lipoprotein [Myxococcales bacterium]|nr:EfeM/EfeO family lipoprotein [Myxococcales bacterium]